MRSLSIAVVVALLCSHLVIALPAPADGDHPGAPGGRGTLGHHRGQGRATKEKASRHRPSTHSLTNGDIGHEVSYFFFPEPFDLTCYYSINVAIMMAIPETLVSSPLLPMTTLKNQIVIRNRFPRGQKSSTPSRGRREPHHYQRQIVVCLLVHTGCRV